MKNSFNPFNGLILLLFGWTAYLDSTIWLSGMCTGMGVIMLIDFIDAWAKSARADRST